MQFNSNTSVPNEEDQLNLVGNMILGNSNSGGIHSLSSVASEEDEEREEFSSLLEKNSDLKKTYDFLNNW